MSTYIQHPISSMEYNEDITSSIYMNKFDYNSVNISALRKMDGNGFNEIKFSGTRELFDVYQEYEIYAQKINRLNPITEACNNSNDQKASSDTVIDEKTIPPFRRVKNTFGDVIFVKQETSHKNIFLNFCHYNMLIPNRNDTYTCLCCGEEIDNLELCQNHIVTEKHKTQLRKQIFLIDYEDNIIRRVQSDCFHCGICNNVLLKKDLKDHIETDKKHNMLKTYSEACAEQILKKIKSDTQAADTGPDMTKFINVEVANETMLLHKMNWHMYHVFPKKYFCTLCVNGGDIDMLQNHLDSSEHLNKLYKCRILPEYGLSIIRTLSENHQHCGVCNTYLNLGVVENHVKKPKHKSNLSLWVEFTKKCNIQTEEEKNVEDDSKEKVKVKSDDDVTKKVPKDIQDLEIPNEDVIVKHNGSIFCVNILSFNCIVKAKTTFHCICCFKNLEKDELSGHMEMDDHKTALSSAEVMAEFPENYIRKISNTTQIWAHCGICNSRTTYNLKNIQDHIETAKHKDNFAHYTDIQLKKSNVLAVVKTVSKRTIPVFTSKSEKYSHEIEIAGQKYILNLHTFRAWHTIRGWGMYFSCCFACQTLLTTATMFRHTRSQEHKENLKNCVVLDSYGTNYLKVINWSHCVYCTFCNDLVESDDINSHLNLDSHMEKQKCCLTKLENRSKGDSKLSIQIKKLSAQSLGSNSGNQHMKNEERKLKECESDLMNSSELSESKDEYSITLAPLKHRDGSVGTIQRRTQNLSEALLETCQFIGNENHKKISQESYSKYIILDLFQDRVLVTMNAFNTIVENTFCNTCKENFITDTKKHCTEPQHILKLNTGYYELSDGSIARKYSKLKIHCLVCDTAVSIKKLKEHVQSRIHSNNLNSAKPWLGVTQSLHQNELTRSMNPVLVSRIEFFRNQEFVFLEFGHSSLVLTYNSWHGIVENRVTCHVCGKKYISSNIESINEHCNDDSHEVLMRKKVIQRDFTRKITKVRSYCMICNFIGNPVQIQDHIESQSHEMNLKAARTQAAIRASDGLRVVNCAQYFKQYLGVMCMQNIHKPVPTIAGFECITVHRDGKSSATSEDSDSEDSFWNRDCVGSGQKYVTSMEKINSPIPTVCYTACEAPHIELFQNTENSTETATTAVREGDDYGKEKQSIFTTDDALSAVIEGDVPNIPAEKINVDSVNTHILNYVGSHSCHVCGLAIPTQFLPEHMEDEFHKKMTNLMQTVLERIKNSFGQIGIYTSRCGVTEGVQYCSTCNCILRNGEFPQHIRSTLHKHNEDMINVIEQTVCVLRSSDNNQLVKTHTGEFVPVETRLEEGIKFTTNRKIGKDMEKFEFGQTASICSSEESQHETECNDFEKNKACLIDVSGANKIKNIKEVNLNVPHFDVDVVGIDATKGFVSLGVDDRKININVLSYHGIYPKPGNAMWCALCKMKKNDLDSHLTSEKHLSRLKEAKFNGADLIRFLSEFYAHCGLCHLMFGIKELEVHLNSETHQHNRTSATVDSEKELVAKELKDFVHSPKELKDFVLTQPLETNKSEIGHREVIRYDIVSDKERITNKYNADNIKVVDSKSLFQAIERSITVDTMSQTRSDSKAGEVIQKSVLSEVQPSTSMDRKVESLTYKPELTFDNGIKNNFIRSNVDAGFPYSCTLCSAKISCFQHVEDHLKGATHAKNLKKLNTNTINEPNENQGNDVGIKHSLSYSNQNTPLAKETKALQNSSAVNKTTENLNEMTCTICDVKIQKAIWEQHTQGKKHKSNLQDVMKSNVQNEEKSLIDNLSSLQPKSDILTPSVKSKGESISEIQNDVKTNCNEHNIASIDAKPCSSTSLSYIPAVCDVQIPSMSAKYAHEMALRHAANLKMQNGTNTQNQLHPVQTNTNVVRDNSSAHKSPDNVQRRSNEFISFVAESHHCPYFCSLCNAKMPSLHHVEEHLKGAKHMLNLTTGNNNVPSTVQTSTNMGAASDRSVNYFNQTRGTMTLPPNPIFEVNVSKESKGSPTTCILCNVKVPIAVWNQHVKGKIHQSKLKRNVQNNSSTFPNTIMHSLPTDKHGGIQQSNVASAPIQSSSSSMNIVKVKHPTQTVCTVCNVIVPKVNMVEHIQGKVHCENLKRMFK